MTISEFEPQQVTFMIMSYACSMVHFPHRLCITDYPRVGHNRNVWGMKLGMCSKIEHNIIEAITEVEIRFLICQDKMSRQF